MGYSTKATVGAGETDQNVIREITQKHAKNYHESGDLSHDFAIWAPVQAANDPVYDSRLDLDEVA
ncbi:MAG: hypothetical protein AAF204_00900 [Pseudomonadota bacterium]